MEAGMSCTMDQGRGTEGSADSWREVAILCPREPPEAMAGCVASICQWRSNLNRMSKATARMHS